MPGARDRSGEPRTRPWLRLLARPADRRGSEEPEGAQLSDADAERILRRLDWQVVRRLDGLLQGEHRSLFPGRGLDLAEVREYQAGDDVRLIDWNVTARTDQPHVRQYHEDREVTAWLLVDRSASVDFGTARMRKRDLAVEFTGAMARLLTRRGNRTGALVFSGGIDRIVPPRGGRQQVLAIIQELMRPERPGSGGVTNLAEVLTRAGQMIRRRSLVFIVSDFICDSSWEAPLRRLAQRHEVTAVWLRDPREEELPDIGPLVLEDAETGQQVDVNTHSAAFRRRFQTLVEQRHQRLGASFARSGVDLLNLSTDRDLLGDVIQFAQRRRRAGNRQQVASKGIQP